MRTLLLALYYLPITLAQRPSGPQRGRPGSDEGPDRQSQNDESPIWSERVVWQNPPARDDSTRPSEYLSWPIGSMQTLRWKTSCENSAMIEVFAKGTQIGDGGQKLFENKPRNGNDEQSFEWTVSLDGHHLSDIGAYHLMVWVDCGQGKDFQKYSAYVNIVKSDASGYGSPQIVVEKQEVKTSTPPLTSTAVLEETSTSQAILASVPKGTSISAPATTSVEILAAGSTVPPPKPATSVNQTPISTTILADVATSNPFFSHLPQGPVINVTDTLTLSFVPTTAVVMVTETPLPSNQGGQSSKQKGLIAVAVVSTVGGLAMAIVAIYLIWRRWTGIRVARLEPGHHVVGPNEFVIMRGNEWADKMESSRV